MFGLRRLDLRRQKAGESAGQDAGHEFDCRELCPAQGHGCRSAWTAADLAVHQVALRDQRRLDELRKVVCRAIGQGAAANLVDADQVLAQADRPTVARQLAEARWEQSPALRGGLALQRVPQEQVRQVAALQRAVPQQMASLRLVEAQPAQEWAAQQQVAAALPLERSVQQPRAEWLAAQPAASRRAALPPEPSEEAPELSQAASSQLSPLLPLLPCLLELFLRQQLPRRQCPSNAFEPSPRHLPEWSSSESSFP